MRVAFALVSREAGGAEFQTCLLADQLRQRGHQVRMYCTDSETSPTMLDQFAPIPARVARRLRFPGCLSMLPLIAQVRRWLRRDRIDVAVGVLALPHAILTAAALGTRVRIIGRRSCVWSECREYGTYNQQLPGLARWQARWGWRTRTIIANSDEAYRSAVEIEGWPAHQVEVIPNGWPEFPRNAGLSSVPYYCARPRAEKAVDLATQEFARAGVPLALAFEPPDWHRVGILAHCSRADAMSNAVGMAMAHGIPVVAFRLPGNRELLGSGHCVPRWDYAALANRVEMLRRSPSERVRVGAELHERTRVLFPLKVMVDAWEDVLTREGGR